MNLKNYLHKNPKLKKRIHRFIMHPVKTRPYWWIRILQPIYITLIPQHYYKIFFLST